MTELHNATVSHKAGHWYVSFLVEDGEIAPEKHALPNSAVGIDRGMKAAVATSDGEFYDRRFTTTGEAERRRRLQQSLARAKRGSNNRGKVRAKLAKHSARTAERRSDFCRQVAHDLTSRYGLVVLENLKTTNMTKSAAGTIEAPGRNVAQKAGLNRGILDKGWGKIEIALTSAARYTGSEVRKVPAAYTSQRCHRCGLVDANNRKSQTLFACTGCQHSEHADVNAAKNIRAAGLAVPACGDLGISRSVKQEPATPRGGTRQLAAVGIPRL